MKNLTLFGVAALGVVFLCGLVEAQSYLRGSGKNETRMTLVINPDGSCAFTNEAVQARKQLEAQVNSWARYANRADLDSEDEVAPSEGGQATTNKALTNEELAAKLREMHQQSPYSDEAVALKVENVDASTNLVRLVTSRHFASLKELLSENPYSWGPTVLMVQKARVEIDTNSNLRLTFKSSPEATRYAKAMSRSWKSSEMKFEWRLMLPGRVLSSGLPDTAENGTGISLNTEKPESIETALKLMGADLVITAEPAGIRLNEPLDSEKLVRAAWRQKKAAPELPITDAGPGFLAEPLSISLSTVHRFPEGEKYSKGDAEYPMFQMRNLGTVVSAKLFPPKGREIRSVSGVQVKAAKDDKGRVISAMSGEWESESFDDFTSYQSGDSEEGGAARIEIRLALPAPDAKTIEELDCEAVALSIGGWKELVLTNLQANATNAIDLGEVLPGAKLFIKKLTARSAQKSIEATLEGPAEVQQLELKVKTENRRGGHSSASDRRSTTSGNKTTRNVTIQSFEFSMGESAKATPTTLLVRYPQDTKRERVKFKLTSLDLL